MDLHWLNHISTLSTLFPMLASIYGFRRLNGELRILSWLFILASVVETVVFIKASQRVNNLWLINIYTLIEGFIFCYILGKLSESKQIFVIAMSLFAFYLISWFYITYFAGSILDLNGKEKTIKGLILIFLSGYFLVRLSMNDDIVLFKDYRFWIGSSILIYFSMTLVVFSTAAIFLEDHKATFYSWIIHSATNIISNILFAYGFLWYYRKTSLST